MFMMLSLLHIPVFLFQSPITVSLTMNPHPPSSVYPFIQLNIIPRILVFLSFIINQEYIFDYV